MEKRDATRATLREAALHLFAEQGYDRTTTAKVANGQDGDNPMLAPLLREHPGAHRQQNLRLLGDQAYSHPSTRARLRQMKIKATIPERSDQITRRKAKGCAGGRPPVFDPEPYCHRNTVERSFNRLKQWRGVATRYDKYALTYLGGACSPRS